VGLLLEGVGKGLGNTEAVTAERLAGAVQSSAQHLQSFSKAELGDKTMIDALVPFVDTLVGQVGEGVSISDAWRSAAEACRSAAEATASLVPKIGRARPLAERQRRHTRSRRDIAGPDCYRDR
jgi:dihydroxyacetone kinase